MQEDTIEDDPKSWENHTTLWLGGDEKTTPTLQLRPIELARAYKMDKPCRIRLIGRPDLGGILIKFAGEHSRKKVSWHPKY